MSAMSVPRVIFLGADGVHWAEHPPPPELAPWVATIWHLRCERPYSLRIIPDGCTDIIRGDIVGSLSKAIVAKLEAGDETYGIRFHPGAFTALFGVPASELVDLRVPLEDVVRPRRLRDLARDADKPDPLAAAALNATDIRELARDSGYSPRQLHRRVFAATGHNPKRLSRIGRMQALLAAGRGHSWAQTATEFGYHDESHMINDVRRLADATPDALLAGRQRRIQPRDPVARPIEPDDVFPQLPHLVHHPRTQLDVIGRGHQQEPPDLGNGEPRAAGAGDQGEPNRSTRGRCAGHSHKASR
jgi:AraC-like DNA-binding protein